MLVTSTLLVLASALLWWRSQSVAETVHVSIRPENGHHLWTYAAVLERDGFIVSRTKVRMYPAEIEIRWKREVTRQTHRYPARTWPPLTPDPAINVFGLRAERHVEVERGDPTMVSWLLRIPFWLACVAFAVGPTRWLLLWKRRRSAAWRAAGRCGSCGYDLRESPERCPECGTPVVRRLLDRLLMWLTSPG